MRYKIKYLIILLSLLFIFKGCTCTIGTYYGTGYYAPAWSPDGSRIYYFRNDLTVDEVQNGIPPLAGTSYEYRKNEWYICSSKPDGSDRKVVIKVGEISGEFGGPGEMDISSKGEIVYASPANRKGIWMADTMGNNDHQVLSWGTNPRWAFNETKIIFEGDDNHKGIWLMDKDGSNLSQILSNGRHPSFCDANQKVLYYTWPAQGYGMIYCYSFHDSSIDTLIEGKNADWDVTGENFVCHPKIGNVSLFHIGSITPYRELPLVSDDWGPPRWSSTDNITLGYQGIWVINSDGSDKKKILEDVYCPGFH